MRKTSVLVFAAALLSCATAFAQTAPAASALKIVVIKGEDAVNVIQRKTAVAPIVEVRDRNNLPVPGASVTFALSGQGGAFAGGAQSLTVVTNAAGQATAVGFTPTAAGAVNISATATFQGQTVVATITQTNVMTAAEVAGTTTSAGGGSGAAGGSGSGAGTGTGTGAAGGTGGGMSGTTLGIIGGVAGVGGLVGIKAAGGGGDSPSPTATTPTTTTASTSTPTTSTAAPPTTAPPATSTPTPAPTPAPTSSSSFSGPMDGTFNGTSAVTVSGAPGLNCTFSMRMTGTSSVRVTAASGTGNGTLEMTGRQVVTTNSCGEVAGLLADQPFTWSAPVDVSGNTVKFTQEFRDSGTVAGASYTSSATTSFTGTLTSSGITGTLTINSVADIRGDGFTSHAQWTGSIPITLK